MPIDYEIDHEHRIVIARGRGVLTDADVFGYQEKVWSLPEVAGYDELVDMTDVESVILPSADRMRDLATLSAGMDPKLGSARMAIVATRDEHYGLGRMYEAYRSFQPESRKEVAVFRTAREALAFLGKEGMVPGKGGG